MKGHYDWRSESNYNGFTGCVIAGFILFCIVIVGLIALIFAL